MPRVVFGVGGRARVAAEAERLGIRRLFAVCTPGRADTVRELLRTTGRTIVGVFDGARQHVPIADLEAARIAEAAAKPDGYVSIGGGSATGFAKALALGTGLPIIAIPTTYAGSEVTPVWGMTDRGEKTTGHNDRVLPRTVIYDAELTLTLPPNVAAASGMNAIAHCVGALHSPDSDPITSLFAEEGIRTMAMALPAIARTPDDITVRSHALYGACLAGLALGSVRMGLHHRLAHLLGGTFGLPHAETHAVLLPYTVLLKIPDAPDRKVRIARALGCEDAVAGLFALARRAGAPESLRAVGLRRDQIAEAAVRAADIERSAGNPGREAELRQLLRAAYAGEPPDPGAHG